MIGWRGMAGLIVPANNGVVLPELYRVLPEGVTAYETRMRAGAHVTAEAVERMVAEALGAGEMLAEAGVDVIGYCCMGSSVLKGWDWEDELLARLAEIGGCPVTSANRAMLAALRRLGAATVALITPYPPVIDEAIPDFFAAAGIAVRSIAKVDVKSYGEAPAHNRDIRYVEPRYLYRLAREIDLDGVDAVGLLATDMETLSIIDAIERDCGVPVVSNNQALVWQIVRLLELDVAIPGYGRLLAEPEPPSEERR